ncbi:MAG: isochorismatase family protein [Tannerellaceae bacterium]|nr:isochorismatase family protein [Tannerellaceae bacterium]
MVFIAVYFLTGTGTAGAQSASPLPVSMQERVPSDWEGGEGAWMAVNRIEAWNPSETALIICDMWDKHWCDLSNARFEELAVALNGVVAEARRKGVKIVHAPSDCMDYYTDYPQRKEAMKYRDAKMAALANGEKLPSEKDAVWPVDASDEGCESEGCHPHRAWTKQTDLLAIEKGDLISDSGAELGAYFKKKGIKNVILTGVATNMCVMARSFGLRAMKRMGMNVVLMRDMTDLMYNPAKAPFVDHFSGLDLMVEYIETYVCPSIVSSGFTHKKPFRFSGDRRKRIAFLTAEGEYHANQRLPEFAHELTLKNIHCDFALGVPRMEGPGRHNLENLQILEEADLAILFIRRRALEPEKMTIIKNYIRSGRPVLGIRTSSVAFDANGNVPREGGGIVAATEKASGFLEQWPELDRDIWGGNYHGHYEHLEEGTEITIVPGMENHPLLKGVGPFNSLNWLYQCAPLRSEKAQVLLLGANPGKPLEPVFWLNGDNIIYTSLGHWDDWEIESFRRLMFNTVTYLLNQPIAASVDVDMEKRAQELKNLRWGMFICWSFSTFSGEEWTHDVKDVGFFRAKEVDTDQWARTAKEAGMGYILFLTKHHDGFCLWDTQTTDRKVTKAPLGKDVLAELRNSCDKYGIKLALYFSEGEFDWPKPPAGQPVDKEVLQNGGGLNPEMKKAQLKELLTGYGPIEYIWFDHAVGTGGLSHEETTAWCKQFQPACFIGYNHGDQTTADIRLGEMGKPGTLEDAEGSPYMEKNLKNRWKLAEFTYPILPDHKGGAMWFYSLPEHDQLVHPVSKLWEDYRGAVKYGNIFSIDVGPDYNGKLRDVDVKTLQEVGRLIREHYPD